MAPRLWPPLPPCILPLRSAALRWPPRSPRFLGATADHESHGATASVVSMTQRPVIIVWKMLPPGFARQVARSEGGVPGKGGRGGAEEVASAEGGGGESEEWSSKLETWHEEVVVGCEEKCVSMQGGTQQLDLRGTQGGAAGEGCHVGGYADLVIYGHSDMGEVLPLDTALKGQRQVWGRISAHRDAPNSGGAPHDTPSDALFEVDISPEFFPEMFLISEEGLGDGKSGGSGRSKDSEGSPRVSVCGLCEHVRKTIHKRCGEGAAVPGRGADDPHILIMLPQNGRRYSPSVASQSPARS